MSEKIQELKYKIIISALLLFFIFVLFYFSKSFYDNSYDIRISIKSENFSSRNTDDIFAVNLSHIFSEIKEIKTVTAISSYNYCNIYIKFRLFLNIFSNRYKTIQKIKISLDDFISKTKLSPEIDFDFDYNKKYDNFLIFYYTNSNFEELINFCGRAFNKIKNSKTTDKILDFQKYKIADYIYFTDSDLMTYNITVPELQTLIQTNNTYENSTLRNNASSHAINISSNIKDINDLSNLVLYYQDDNFSNELKNIFKIEEKLQEDDFSIFYDDKNIMLYALKKRPFIPQFIFEFLIKNELKKICPNNFIEYKLINTSAFSKFVITLENNYSNKDLDKIREKISKNFKDQVYFLKTDPPKISRQDIFQETEKNKITILTKNKNKLKNFLKENNIKFKNQNSFSASKKEKILFYNLNSYGINDYFFNKKEVLKTILANNEGLICDYYYDNSNRIKIILKNKENSNFIYSKKYKCLVDISMLLKKELREDYIFIVRKNGNIF